MKDSSRPIRAFLLYLPMTSNHMSFEDKGCSLQILSPLTCLPPDLQQPLQNNLNGSALALLTQELRKKVGLRHESEVLTQEYHHDRKQILQTMNRSVNRSKQKTLRLGCSFFATWQKSNFSALTISALESCHRPFRSLGLLQVSQ